MRLPNRFLAAPDDRPTACWPRRFVRRHLRVVPHLLLGLLWAVPATGQQLCPPVAGGVPALGGPPQWWDVNANGVFPEYPREDDRLDDPRWRGAAGFTDVGERLMFRALRSTSGGTSAMYLSWRVLADPAPDVDEDVIYVGVAPPMGAPGDTVIFIIKLKTNSPGRAQPSGAPFSAFTVSGYRRNGAGGWSGLTSSSTPALPAWASDSTRLWLEPIASGGNTTWAWAVQMWVPLSDGGLADGLNLPAGSTMFHATQVKEGAGSGPATQYTWPDGLVVTKSGLNYTWPAFSDWGALSLTGGCTQGISLSASNVGTTNTPSSEIDLTGTNTFYVRPTNGMVNRDIDPGTMQARVRIANWGTQADWNQVPSPGQNLWTDITSSPLPANPVAIPGRATATDPAHTATAAEQIQFNWTPSACMVGDFTGSYPAPPPGQPACTDPAHPEYAQRYPRRLHQCMLVELSVTGATQPYEFLNMSVYRNMDFVGASTFAREAEVSLRGLNLPGSGTLRDVYLYVTTLNMPVRVQSRDTVQENAAVLRSRTAMLEQVKTGRPVDRLEFERWMPTYRVYAAHVTGDSTDEGRPGRPYAVLHPQTSFGYYVEHAGPLYGWSSTLEGTGNTRVELVAPNFYRIRTPNNGVASITTTIEARETACPAGFSGCACRFRGGSGVSPLRVGGLSLPGDGTWPLGIGVVVLGVVAYLPMRRRK